MQTEFQKMKDGDWYTCIDAELETFRVRARDALHHHNTTPPATRGNISDPLRNLFKSVAKDARIEARFHCAYGFNITLGAEVFLNAGCTILDTASVEIGDQSMLGPNVQIYCAEHHKDPLKRVQGLEVAKPVTIGKRVWIGGGAIILAGVRVGDEAIIGAGSVVTRDVASGVTVVGNPARAVS